MANSTFYLVKYVNMTEAVDILPRYDYLGSSKAEVSKFATLSWHSQRESEIKKWSNFKLKKFL